MRVFDGKSPFAPWEIKENRGKNHDLEDEELTVCKRILAVLALACLLLNMAPAALATGAEDARLSARVDTTELKRQVAMANGLNAYDYTIETWTPLQKALDKGNDILKGTHGQYAVTNAAEAIEAAMANLVRMDYSRLEAALGVVYNKIDENPEMHDLCLRINTAVEKARPLLVSGNQQAVDAMVITLNKLMEETENTYMGGAPVEPQIIREEVEIEVLPTDDFCNIPMHRTWPVLFVISAALNVALIVVLTYVIMKKRQTVDTTPLVSYDIDDDLDY